MFKMKAWKWSFNLTMEALPKMLETLDVQSGIKRRKKKETYRHKIINEQDTIKASNGQPEQDSTEKSIMQNR